MIPMYPSSEKLKCETNGVVPSVRMHRRVAANGEPSLIHVHLGDMDPPGPQIERRALRIADLDAAGHLNAESGLRHPGVELAEGSGRSALPLRISLRVLPGAAEHLEVSFRDQLAEKPQIEADSPCGRGRLRRPGRA